MTGMLVVTLFVVTAIGGALLGEEALAQSRRLSGWMVRRAARGLPTPVCERYREEWLAELDANPGGPISRLCFAASLFISWRRVADELVPSPSDLAGGAIYEVRNVPEAYDVAATMLQIATHHADSLIEEAKAYRDRRRLLRRHRANVNWSAVPLQIDFVVPDDGSDAARLLEIARRNAVELVEEAGVEATLIRAEPRRRA